MKYTKVISRWSASQITSGGEDAETIKEVLLKASIYKLLDHVASELANAQLDKPHHLELNFSIYAREIDG